jgi:lysophospholipase L1-like esterase
MVVLGQRQQYWQYMRQLFNIQVLPLDDTSGIVARDLGIRGITGTYANTAGLTLANDLPPFKAPILGASSYVNHNAANIAANFSYSTGSYHFWVKGPLALWDDTALRRLPMFQVDTSNRIDVQKLANVDSLLFDWRVGAASNTVTVINLTYSSGWFPIGLRWNKAGNAFDIFVNGHKAATVSNLGNLTGTVANASIGGNPYFPAGSFAYLGLGTGLVSDTQFASLAGRISRQKLIVFDGDSLTVGLQNGAVPYPKQLIRLYYGDTPVPNCVGYNCGNSAETVADMIASAPATVDIYRGDAGFSKYICIFWGGTNDINLGETAATVQGRIQTYCMARRAAGWKVFVMTIIPNGTMSAAEKLVRVEVNNWIKANYASFADGLIDPTANAAFDEESDTGNTTYYNADTAHLTTVGYGLIASIVKTAIDAL